MELARDKNVDDAVALSPTGTAVGVAHAVDAVLAATAPARVHGTARAPCRRPHALSMS